MLYRRQNSNCKNRVYGPKEFEKVLHQIEFEFKKTRPTYGLALLSAMIPSLLHGPAPLAIFDINEHLARIRADFKAGGLFERLVREQLIENSHKLVLHFIPDEKHREKAEAKEKAELDRTLRALSEDERVDIRADCARLEQWQQNVQDTSVLPSLTLADIPRTVERIEHEKSMVSAVPVYWFDQPTNGITYARIRCSLRDVPQRLRRYLPIYSEFISRIGTPTYDFREFNTRMLGVSGGLEASLDSYFPPYHKLSASEADFARSSEGGAFQGEQTMLFSLGFLNQNINKAFGLLSELLSTPNFDDKSNISDLVRMGSVTKANNIGNEGLTYGMSFANSGIRRISSFCERLQADLYFCNYAAEILKTADPTELLHELITNLTELTLFIFRDGNFSVSIHGEKAKFPLVEMQLQLLVNAIKMENPLAKADPEELHRLSAAEAASAPEWQPQYHKVFFKTPLNVNNCAESLLIPPRHDPDYAPLMVMSSLLTHSFLLQSVREKGGAYGGGCTTNENGLLSFYSFRDPRVEETFENFENAVADVIDGQFGGRELDEAKLVTFQKLDKALDASLKGLLQFTRGYESADVAELRMRALAVS